MTGRPVFVVHVRAEPGVDVIRALRGWLKVGLRNFGLRCISINHGENVMGYDFAKEEKQQEALPPDTYRLKMKIQPGGFGENDLLTRSKSGSVDQLKAEFTVVEGSHSGQKLWERFTVEINAGRGITPEQHNKLKMARRISGQKLRAIIEAVRGIDSDDNSEEANKRRYVDSLAELDGCEFYADVDIKKGENGYRDQNIIAVIITKPTKTMKPTKRGEVISLPGRAMDDEIPF